ncbi:MAG: LytTR family DNA-binding domain-containing protein [Myxococcota bacterium]
MTLKVLVVDDEYLARVALIDLLRPYENVDVVAEADSVQSAATHILEHDPDVIFLDIELPDGNGFDLFDRVDVRGHVVFQTAYGEHALRAFEVNALDYLVKPAEPSQIDRALARARSASAASAASVAATALGPEDRVRLQERRRVRFCRVRDIAYIRSADDYAEVHLANGEVALVPERLQHWESRLPDSFVRIHRSTLINADLSEEMLHENGAWQVRLHGCSDRLTVSRRLAQQVKAKILGRRGEGLR